MPRTAQWSSPSFPAVKQQFLPALELLALLATEQLGEVKHEAGPHLLHRYDKCKTIISKSTRGIN